ncbi:MAG: hypothetical protein HY460_01250, partial [Parcubacteria group bacterium]|nr:hypothetical protein [Parcubacteria group bacterium]
MQRFILTIKILGGLLLIWYGLAGWALEGSVFFVALVLLGLFEFLGALTRRLTGKMTFGTYRKILFVLLLGAVTGALLFDLPAIYLFKVWTYHGGIPNPLANIPLYGIEALGWGAFLIIFYDAYTLVHLAFDSTFHSIGFSSRNRSVIDHLFSFLGVVGICLFFVSVGLALSGQTASAWPPTIGGFGVWFMLEDIEYKRSHRTLLLSTV